MADLLPGDIAERTARRMPLVLREVGGEGAPVDTGWMSCDLPGSWADYAAGLGVDGPVSDESLDRLVDFYRTRGRCPKVQLTPYQHPSLLEGLAARGFVTHDLSTVMVRPLPRARARKPSPGLTLRRLRHTDDQDVAAFVASQMAGFLEGAEPPAALASIMERVARIPRATFWLIERDGQVIGSGGLERFESSAVLIAGCVHPEARRQGVHSDFIELRLDAATEMGAGYAVIASKPGGPTERNALRAGFSVAYTLLELRGP